MSLVPYRDDSLILDDPHSDSIMILNPSVGSVRLYQQLYQSQLEDIGADENVVDIEEVSSDKPPRDTFQFNSIASFKCPQCGTQIDPVVGFEYLNSNPSNGNLKSESNSRRNSTQRNDNGRTARSHSSHFSLSNNYFRQLENSQRRFGMKELRYNEIIGSSESSGGSNKSGFFIPEELFLPGYFRKFFKTIGLLGRGARGSVFKVVHRIGVIDLGLFALKKIPIGNDSIWFEKCIREVKALSSITHGSVNLITYNHVWLEMEHSNGLVRTTSGEEITGASEEIPCLFILQQYCAGGNLEDVILNKVFKKFKEFISNEEKKRIFRLKRDMGENCINEALGLSTNEIADIIKDIANGLNELHNLGLIHRDLKPSNCLLLHEYHETPVDNHMNSLDKLRHFPPIVIGDLGESQVLGECRSATGATGTLEFTAPEVIISDNNLKASPLKSTNSYNEYSFSSDIYALGMILYFIIFGELPFGTDMEIAELKMSIINLEGFDKKGLIEKHKSMKLKPINYDLLDLMFMLLNKNPDKRPKAGDIGEIIDRILIDKDTVEIFPETDIDVTLGNEVHFRDILNSTPVFDSSESKTNKQEQKHKYDNNLAVSNLKQMLTIKYKVKPIVNDIVHPGTSYPAKLLILVRPTFYIAMQCPMTYFIMIYSPPDSVLRYVSAILLGMSINQSSNIQMAIIAVQFSVVLQVYFTDYCQFLLSILNL